MRVERRAQGDTETERLVATHDDTRFARGRAALSVLDSAPRHGAPCTAGPSAGLDPRHADRSCSCYERYGALLSLSAVFAVGLHGGRGSMRSSQ